MSFYLGDKSNLAGMALLEQKFVDFARENPDKLEAIRSVAHEVVKVQRRMRALIDDKIAEICPVCASSCCQIMAVEGWFTVADYFVYRVLNDAPFPLLIEDGPPNGCKFLGPRGCVLPPASRPFPCVKVNCHALNQSLDAAGHRDVFESLVQELDALQKSLWPLIG
jgi:hypothetical protein